MSDTREADSRLEVEYDSPWQTFAMAAAIGLRGDYDTSREPHLERDLARQGREFLIRAFQQMGYHLGALDEFKGAYE